MMKSVKEIKEIANDRYMYPVNVTNGRIFEILVGITEHLEAQAVRTDNTIRREGMIEALRWVDMQDDVNYASSISRAITRLENGGEL